MDYKEPQTRKETKGGKKKGKDGPYSQKRVRQLEALREKTVALANSLQPQKP